jgi:pyruvate dehydrogenase E2 component (dihydrolipoamide acetyltransferase)
MAIEFKLPEVSEGVESVDVAEILVKAGDVIESGAVICEVETDKAVAEITCPHAGRIERVLVASGDSIAIGQPLIEIEPDAAATEAPAEPAPAAEPETQPETTPEPPAASSPEAAGEPQIVEFCLPHVSEGIDAVDVAAVSVSVGDTIDADAVVCEVETDKAVADINCPHAGKITAVHIAAGDTIAIGVPLISIETVGAKTSGAAATAPAATAASASSQSEQPQGEQPPKSAPVKTHQVPTTPRPTPTSAVDRRPPAPAGPATRRLARKLGVDLYDVKGSARGGRITIEDVEGWVKERLTSGVPGAAGQPGVGIVAATALPDFSQFGPIEKQSLNKIFRTAASNLHSAWVTIPHVTQHDLADITELESARKRYVKANPNAPKITMTAIMIKAVVAALKAFPNFNASIDMQSGELIVKKYYHIGVAVDTPNGLVVPVIRNCDQKNVLQVAADLSEMAGRARDRKLKTEEMQGASFTITNLGGIGGTAFTPIVNHPEVAILGMSRGQKQLVLEDSMVVERLMLPLSLSYDHRAVNGADAARFIVKLSSSLSNFFELF